MSYGTEAYTAEAEAADRHYSDSARYPASAEKLWSYIYETQYSHPCLKWKHTKDPIIDEWEIECREYSTENVAEQHIAGKRFFYRFTQYRVYNALDRYVENARSRLCRLDAGDYYSQAQALQTEAQSETSTQVPYVITRDDTCVPKNEETNNPLYQQYVSIYGESPLTVFNVSVDHAALDAYAQKFRQQYNITLGRTDFTTKEEATQAAKQLEVQNGTPELVLLKDKITPPISETANPYYKAYTEQHGIPPESVYEVVPDNNCRPGARYENSDAGKKQADACSESVTRRLGAVMMPHSVQKFWATAYVNFTRFVRC